MILNRTHLRLLTFIIFLSGITSHVWNVIDLPQRPVIYFHGLGDKCMESQERRAMRCIETGADLLGSLESIIKQADLACKILIKEIFPIPGKVNPDFVNGFHLVGMSQGGLIARTLFHRCFKIRKLIKRIITVGTPNLGVNTMPNFTDRPFLMRGIKFFEALTIKAYRINNWSFYQYKNELRKENGIYKLQQAPLIKYLLKNPDDDEIYSSLEGMVNIAYLHDEMVNPPNSAIFGSEINNDTNEVESFEKSNYYKIEGLGKLYDQGRMVNCLIDGFHLHHSSDEFSEILDFTTEQGIMEVQDKEDPDVMEYLYKKSFVKLLRNGVTPTTIKCEFKRPKALI